MFTSLDLGMNGEIGTECQVQAMSSGSLLCHSSFLFDRIKALTKKDFLSNREGILSDGEIREMNRREPSWGDYALRQ